jgi:spore maturation protein CgeB
MRALVVGPVAAWSVADVYRGWCKGLQACGVHVYPLTLTDRYLWYERAVVLNDDKDVVKSMSTQEAITATSQHILAACEEFDPDIVVVVHGANVDPSVLAKLRRRLVLVLTECPYEDQTQAGFALAAEPDLILLNDPTHQGVFDQIAPSFYVPHAYDPDVHHPGGVATRDACFVGTGFYNRVEWLERVDWTGIDFVLAGEWGLLTDDSPLWRFLLHKDDPSECMDNRQTSDLYRATRAGLNVYRYEQQGEFSKPDPWAAGPREIEMAACHLWFARQSAPESDELFPMLPTYSEPEELGDLIRWALAHPVERDDAARRAGEAIADRTFTAHALRTLRRLDH